MGTHSWKVVRIATCHVQNTLTARIYGCHQVWVIGAALWVQLFAALSSCLLTSPQLRTAAATAEVFAPAAAALIWIAVPTQPNNEAIKDPVGNGHSNGNREVSAAADGASAAVAHYNIAAGVGLSLWALTLIELVNQGRTLLPTLIQWVQHPRLSRAVQLVPFYSWTGQGSGWR